MVIFLFILLFQISLCDDYSIPVDFVNKRRPASASAITTTVQWALPSPSIENVSLTIFILLYSKLANTYKKTK